MRSGVRSPSAPPSFCHPEALGKPLHESIHGQVPDPGIVKSVANEPQPAASLANSTTHLPTRAIEWLFAGALFAATALVVVWQNGRLAVLWDLSYVLENSYRISLGDVPYRDFPFAHPPITFLNQASYSDRSLPRRGAGVTADGAAGAARHLLDLSASFL